MALAEPCGIIRLMNRALVRSLLLKNWYIFLRTYCSMIHELLMTVLAIDGCARVVIPKEST